MLSRLKENLTNFDWNKGIKSFFEKARWFNMDITTAFGIQTTVHWSVTLIFLLMLFLAPSQFIPLIVFFFLTVVPHEYGHAIAAKWYGLETKRIVLYPIGGVAFIMPNMKVKMERWTEIVIASAGPAVSLALGILGLGMSWFTGVSTTNLNVWAYIGVINLVMFVFNMMPAFPMDGGRILRAALTFWWDKLTSTRYAYYTSIGFCVLFSVIGLLLGNVGLILTMAVVHYLSRMELQQTIQMENYLAQEKLAKQKVEDQLKEIHKLPEENVGKTEKSKFSQIFGKYFQRA
jgi:Zn-dependent protease